MNGMKVYESGGIFIFVNIVNITILFLKYMYLNVVCFTEY